MMDAHGNPQHKHDQSVFSCHHISQLQIDLTMFAYLSTSLRIRTLLSLFFVLYFLVHCSARVITDQVASA
ncbi:Uncharacterized protein HZ326_20606 [Fusarium oxysporum f. sp. albedinis]|nr:Uncharacterized protein HZ326_20606 [Fusarium oxysporum f. sp. albedinis]